MKLSEYVNKAIIKAGFWAFVAIVLLVVGQVAPGNNFDLAAPGQWEVQLPTGPALIFTVLATIAIFKAFLEVLIW